MTLVIPAYNEAGRISQTLATARAYLASRFSEFELLLVDDGSTDATRSLGEAFASVNAGTHVISIPHQGKAAAVRAGLEAATGDLIAFTDADLATPLDYLPDFVEMANAGVAVVIGSREGIGARRIGEPGYRHLMGRVFNRLVQVAVLPGIEDTQCGFKLFRRDALQRILPRMRLYRSGARAAGPRVTAFDVEMLAIARSLGLPIRAVPVIWTYGEQSKVNPLRDTLRNLLDIATVKLHLLRGRYR